ncbi:MAG: class I SAM-dependent methyltransferase [Anaerolineales bacterium]
MHALHTQRFELPEGHPLSNGYDVVVCLKCGFVYADTTVTQTDYDRFYAEHSKYEDATTGTGGIENPFDWNRQMETARQIADFLQDKNARVLDIGCANGGMLKALSGLGYQSLCGIDPSPVCVENTQRLGMEAHVGSLFEPFHEHAFDCVILSHTLEHIQDVRGALDWINDRLRPDGIVYLETPDANRYPDFIYAPFQDFNTEHINHFSLVCLENLMCQKGFALMEGQSKTLIAGPKIFYPAVYGFWKQTDGNVGALIHDQDLRKSIEEYIKRSKEILNEIEVRLQKILTNSPKIIVWGTGQLTMKLLTETSLARATILAFVDNNPINQGKVLRGMSIIAPNQLDNLNVPIVVATLLHHHAIADQILQMQLPNEIIFLAEE